MYHIWFNEKGNIYMGATPRMTKKRVPHLKKDVLISILNDLNLDRLRYTINNIIPLEELTVRMKIGIDHKYSTCKLHDIQYNEVQLSFIIDHPKDKTVQYHVSIYHDYLDILLDDLLEINLIKEEKSTREALLVNGNIEKNFDEDKEYAPSLNLKHLKEVLKLFYITFDDYDKITNIKYHTIKEVSYPNRAEDRNLIYSSIIIKRHGYTGMLMKFVYNKETFKILIDEKTLSKLR